MRERRGHVKMIIERVLGLIAGCPQGSWAEPGPEFDRRRFAMNTQEIMQMALDLVGMTEIPADSAIYLPGRGIRKVLFAIDIGVPELLLAKELDCDLVIAHHPQAAVLSFPQILDRHVDLMVSKGVPPAAAQKAITALKESSEFRYQAGNYEHVTGVAKLLGLPFMNIHNPLDELGRRIMQQTVDGLGEGATVGEVVAALQEIPELASAPTRVKVAAGRPGNPAGRVVVAHGAGTNGGYEVARTYFEYGIGTVVYIHVDYAQAVRLRAEGKGNLVVTGHIASDLIGINPFLRQLEETGLELVKIGA
ncbi:MAG: Nif3-like dinuclear metal center hexameric protein [Firmicutes bacterium]|nr:Nif3-like dinuclear metal center hexameric protein [Bacillota bacterium]MCL5039685.1 Nif3-like dinuclear metal center hexameric protein [Bacillota bacterium]